MIISRSQLDSNMKYGITIVAFLIAVSVSAQKVKYKKGVFMVDDAAYITAGCDHPASEPCVYFSSTSNAKLFSTQDYKYAKKVRKHVGGGKYVTEDGEGTYYLIKFLGQDKEMNHIGYLKGFVKNVARHGLLDVSGNLDLSKLDEFIEIYGEKNPNAIELE